MNKKFKYLFIILFIFIYGCTKKDKINLAHDDYYQKVDLLANNLAFDEVNSDFDITITKEGSLVKEYHYSINVIQNKKDYSNLKIIAMPLDYGYEDILPSYNVLDKATLQYFKFKLHYYTQRSYEAFKVMLTYEYKDVSIIKYYLIDVKQKLL